KGDELLFKIEKQLKRDVKKVAAATGGIEHSNGGEFVVKRGELRTIGRCAFTTHERGREFAFDLTPFASQWRHQHWLDQRFDVLLTRVMRAKLRAVIGIKAALKKITHDAGLDELPVGFACDRELTNFLFGQLKHSRLFEEMAIEMANLVGPKCASLRHSLEKIFEHLGEMCRILDARFENVGDDALRQQSCVFGKKAEDNSIEETRDAQIFALGDGKFLARARIDQLD